MLDERVLAAGTTQRFVLLLVLFVAASTGVAHDLASRVAAVSGNGHPGDLVWVSYAAPVVLVGVTVWLYRRLPDWKERRSGVVPLAEIGDGGTLAAEFDRLAEAFVGAGELSARPRFVVAPGAVTASAVVFGTQRAPTVRLNAGLVVTRETAPKRFGAIFLHELAHIHNRDVGITYATVAMWRVLLCAVLLPDVAVIVTTRLVGGTAPGAAPVFQDALIIVMAYLTRADILRTRELYADRTAVRRWRVNSNDLLPDRYDGYDAAPYQSRRARATAAFTEVWRNHPSWRLRSQSLTAPEALFALRALPVFGTGLTAAIASAQLASPVGAAGSWAGMVQYLLIAGLTVGVGGVALWRAMVHAVLTGRRLPSSWVAGVWLGTGLAVGELTASVGEAGQPLPAHPEVLLLLVAVVVVLTAWTGQFAELRIRTYRGESLNSAMITGLMAPGLVLAFVLLWWHTEQWVTGWHFSIEDQLARADLSAAHAPWLLRLTALLTALPGSDLGFSGLWWAVPLLWLVPLQLWLARLPMAAPSVLVRAGRAVDGAFTRLERSMPSWFQPVLVNVLFGAMVATLFAGLFGLLLLMMVAGPAGFFVIALLAWLLFLAVWRAVHTEKWRDLSKAKKKGNWLDHAQPGAVPPAVNAPDLDWVVRTGEFGGLACLLGLLAEPLIARPALAAHSWRVDSNLDLAWAVLVICTTMAVVAVWVGASAKSRYPLITTLIAAGITGVTGVIGQYLKGSVDGCLGPLNNLTTTCSWYPIRFLPLAEYTLGYVLAPGLLLSAVVGALAHAGSSLLRSRAHARTIAAATGGTAGVGPLARPRVMVGCVNAVAVSLVLSVTAYQAIVMVAPLPRDDLLFEYATSPTGHIRTGISPLADWVRYAGDTVDRYGGAIDTLANVEKAAAGDPDDVRTVARMAIPACEELSSLKENARDDARLYDPAVPVAAERLWVRYLADVRTTAADCLVLTRATTSAAVSTALTAIDRDVTATLASAQKLADRVGH
ncbi:M48 family metalloprotease [Streptomyces sp. NPDC050448]|uniref:M48 family metalloprotease n=1 Tax=Streptomyces sp. NPDC050448 TaxID=3155404 RepID=UPI0034226F95